MNTLTYRLKKYNKGGERRRVGEGGGVREKYTPRSLKIKCLKSVINGKHCQHSSKKRYFVWRIKNKNESEKTINKLGKNVCKTYLIKALYQNIYSIFLVQQQANLIFFKWATYMNTHFANKIYKLSTSA